MSEVLCLLRRVAVTGSRHASQGRAALSRLLLAGPAAALVCRLERRNAGWRRFVRDPGEADAIFYFEDVTVGLPHDFRVDAYSTRASPISRRRPSP